MRTWICPSSRTLPRKCIPCRRRQRGRRRTLAHTGTCLLCQSGVVKPQQKPLTDADARRAFIALLPASGVFATYFSRLSATCDCQCCSDMPRAAAAPRRFKSEHGRTLWAAGPRCLRQAGQGRGTAYFAAAPCQIQVRARSSPPAACPQDGTSKPGASTNVYTRLLTLLTADRGIAVIIDAEESLVDDRASLLITQALQSAAASHPSKVC